MGLSFVAYGLVFSWVLIHRYRVERLEERYEQIGFTQAVAERRAEGYADTADIAAPSVDLSPPRSPLSHREGGPHVNDYVTGGWSAAIVITVVYCWRTLRRGRVLTRNLPREEQPWR